jgi:hypothetical protein
LKIMSISRPKSTLATLPPTVLKQLMEASTAAIQQYHKEGRILEYYYSPVGAGCSIVILDYKNADDWMKDIATIPMLNYFENDIYPLADGFETTKGMIASLKAMGV